MFIPIRTDKAPKTQPIITQLLIVSNIVVFLIGLIGAQRGAWSIDDFTRGGQFNPHDVSAWNLLTYQFLHDPSGLTHLGFNMLFLWVFGSAVEGRLKHFGFLLFYLIGGAIAGLGHMVFSDAPTIGASGSVCAVTGAYVALFPRSNVKVLMFFFIIGFVHIPSMWFIGIFFALDLLNVFNDGNGVANMAHISGSLFGFTVGMTLLGTGVLPRTDFDAFYLIKQWRRRAEFKSVARQSRGGVWDTPSRQSAPKASQPAAPRRTPPKPEPPRTEEDRAQAAARSELSQLIQRHDLAEASARYTDLVSKGIRVALPIDRQMDLANHLFAEGQHKVAAIAYETALQVRGSRAQKSDVELMLGVLYGRHLNNRSKAVVFLESALPNLEDDGKKSLAETILSEVRTA